MDDEGIAALSDEEILAQEEQLTEDASEAQEANGVAEIEKGAAPEPDEVEALDAQALEELDYDERTELEEEAAELEDQGIRSRRLSQNFVLAEFHCCRGHCAGAHVPGRAVPHLRRLVTQVLQPMRNKFGPPGVSVAD